LKAYFLKMAGTHNAGKEDGFIMIPPGIPAKHCIVEWEIPQRDEQKNY